MKKAVKLNPTNTFPKLGIEYKNLSIGLNDLIQDSKILNSAMDILGATKAEFLSVVTNLQNKLEDAEYKLDLALDQVSDAKSNLADIESYCYDATSSLDSAESDLEDAKMNLTDVKEDVEHAETATAEEVVSDYLETIGFEATKKGIQETGDEGVVSSTEVKEDTQEHKHLRDLKAIPPTPKKSKNLNYDDIKNCDTIDEDGVIKKGGVE